MKADFKKMKAVNAIIADLLFEMKDVVREGISTKELDDWAEDFIIKRGAKPGFKGLYGFPATLCVSINNEVVHGIPSKKRILKDGDIVSVDVGAILGGHNADAARTFAVGNVEEKYLKLMAVTKKSLELGIEQARPGNHVGDIGHAVQKYVEDNGFNVIRDFVGHGVGRKLHEPPEIPNYGTPGAGPLIRKGMFLAIEPMVVTGSWEVFVLADNWTVVTKDGGYAAHFENTIYVSGDGPIVLSEKQ